MADVRESVRPGQFGPPGPGHRHRTPDLARCGRVFYRFPARWRSASDRGPAPRPRGMPTASHDLARAFDRLDDFLAVQGPHPAPDAVLALQRAVGIGAGERAVVRERVSTLTGSRDGEAAGPVLLGILVGLFAAGEAGGE